MIRRVLLVVGLVFVLILPILIWRFSWRTARIGTTVYRYHVVSGKVEVLDAGNWRTPFGTDFQASSLSGKQVESIELSGLIWGVGGVLAGKAEVPSDSSIKGRLGFSIRIAEPNGTVVRERTLRSTVDWHSGANPFILETGLPTPSARQTAIVRLEALN